MFFLLSWCVYLKRPFVYSFSGNHPSGSNRLHSTYFDTALRSAASPETRQAWQLVKDEVAKSEPELASCMVRECVYRGFCPEMKGCGYADTEAFKKAREDYLRIPE